MSCREACFRCGGDDVHYTVSKVFIYPTAVITVLAIMTLITIGSMIGSMQTGTWLFGPMPPDFMSTLIFSAKMAGFVGAGAFGIMVFSKLFDSCIHLEVVNHQQEEEHRREDAIIDNF